MNIDDFGRKLENLVIQGKHPALRAGLSGGSSLGQRPATLFILFFSNIRSVLVKQLIIPSFQILEFVYGSCFCFFDFLVALHLSNLFVAPRFGDCFGAPHLGIS